MDDLWESVVVGGGAAGLSAALVLGRARRRTLLIDAGAPSNAVAHGIGGLLGHDGRPPAELYEQGRREIARYPTVEVRRGVVVDGVRADGRFTLELEDGTRVAAQRVLLATGMDYTHPQVEGIAPRWGRSVFHCPFCHGWEVRERPLAVLDDGATGVHRARLLRAWSDDVTLLTNGPTELDAAETEQLQRAGVFVDEREVVALRGPGTDLESVVFADGGRRACGGLLVPVLLRQRSELARRLGAQIAGPGLLAYDAIEVDAMMTTGVEGLLAAGDVTASMPSVANAIAAGSNAAAMLVRSMFDA